MESISSRIGSFLASGGALANLLSALNGVSSQQLSTVCYLNVTFSFVHSDRFRVKRLARGNGQCGVGKPSNSGEEGGRNVPVTLTAPGVYVEEIPSGVRTITGVATSLTAFIGRTRHGPINSPAPIYSFGDFERQFGGLAVDYPLTYAVRDFFLNGGGQAIIVRLFAPWFSSMADAQAAGDGAQSVVDRAVGADAAAAAAAAVAQSTDPSNSVEPRKSAAQKVASAAQAAAVLPGATAVAVQAAAKAAANRYKLFTLKVDGLILMPASPGTWANQLRVMVDNKVSQSVSDGFGLALTDLFNLTVTDKRTGLIEKHLNLTTKESPRRIDRVLLAESQLIRWQGDYPVAAPNTPATSSTDAASPLDTTLAQAQKALDAAEKDVLANPSDAVKKAARETAKTARDSANSALLNVMAAQDSQPLQPSDYLGSENAKTGLYALADADLFNLMCIPSDSRNGHTDQSVYQDAMAYCAKRRAMLIVDPPETWRNADGLVADPAGKLQIDLGLTGTDARNAAVFYPRVIQPDPLRQGQMDIFVPCGIIAGIMARTDTQRGVWKAPAGIDATLNGTAGLEVKLTDGQNGTLNQVGINGLRSFPVYGRVVWGSRTLRGADQVADEYKYIPVRRTALYIEESLFRGLKWVVFEPNDEPLWSQIRLNVGAFMHNLFRQGAFQGTSPRDAYFVKCDRETTTQNDINLGIVNVVVGFAPLKPAEFVILKLQQMAGQIEV